MTYYFKYYIISASLHFIFFFLKKKVNIKFYKEKVLREGGGYAHRRTRDCWQGLRGGSEDISRIQRYVRMTFPYCRRRWPDVCNSVSIPQATIWWFPCASRRYTLIWLGYNQRLHQANWSDPQTDLKPRILLPRIDISGVRLNCPFRGNNESVAR